MNYFDNKFIIGEIYILRYQTSNIFIGICGGINEKNIESVLFSADNSLYWETNEVFNKEKLKAWRINEPSSIEVYVSIENFKKYRKLIFSSDQNIRNYVFDIILNENKNENEILKKELDGCTK